MHPKDGWTEGVHERPNTRVLPGNDAGVGYKPSKEQQALCKKCAYWAGSEGEAWRVCNYTLITGHPNGILRSKLETGHVCLCDTFIKRTAHCTLASLAREQMQQKRRNKRAWEALASLNGWSGEDYYRAAQRSQNGVIGRAKYLDQAYADGKITKRNRNEDKLQPLDGYKPREPEHKVEAQPKARKRGKGNTGCRYTLYWCIGHNIETGEVKLYRTASLEKMDKRPNVEAVSGLFKTKVEAMKAMEVLK